MSSFEQPPVVDDDNAQEAQLLVRARSGDPEAVTALLRHYEAPLLRYSQRMCGDEEDAKDVLQESLLSAVRHLSEFRGDAKLSTWLFTIARRFCFKRRRKSKFAPDRVESLSDTQAGVASPGPEPESEIAGRELRQQLEHALAELDPDNREILVLRDVEGLTAAEVAAVVGMTEPQVKSRLHRARVAIRKAMTEVLSKEELGLPPDAPAGAPATEGCPDIAAAYSRLLEEQIHPDMCAELQRHVDACPRCQGVCDDMKHTLRTCRTLPAPRVPSELQERLRSAIRTELQRLP